MQKLMISVFFGLSAAIVVGNTGVVIVHSTPDQPHNELTRAFTCYVADGIADRHQDKCLLAAQIEIDTKYLPTSASQKLRESIEPLTGRVSMNRIKDWWNTWAYGLLMTRRQSLLIKNDLEAFKSAVPFKSWDREIIEFSAVKRKTRVIYRSPEGFSFGVSVAETLESESADLSAPVRETEVAIDRDDGTGHADFYAYNKDGRLSTISTFPAGERAAPSICLGCHYSIVKHTFGRKDF
jgi:hypothetical protein